MCGILFSNMLSVSEISFQKALNLLNHRGPDATGYLKLENCFFGHKRLKIVDLDNRSNQPFYSQDGRYVMIFNGEIYNYQDLAREYGIEQHTTSDTEVVVELYAKFGPRFLQWVNGMFALVIFDTITRDVFAARDRLGVKPLYIQGQGENITLSSEIAPILELSGISKFDEIGLRQYRKLRAFFNGRTLYAGVEMFPAAHYMLNGQFYRYWGLPEIEQAPPSDDELYHLIAEAIKLRLISDVSIGSYLSGGLDSTIVAALAKMPHTWTVGFAEQNEFEWARLASEHMKSIHHEVLISLEEFIALGRDMIRKRREPLSVPNEILLYKMTLEVKKENTVILSGEGADELFFGYDRIFRWASTAKTWDIREFDKLYSYGSHEDLDIVYDAVSPFLHRKVPLDIVAHFFQIAHLHGLLRRLDNSTMLCSVEARVPFVDHHPLIERMAGVSFDYRMHKGNIKNPLKRIFKNIVPNLILERKKVGFPVPLDRIFLDASDGITPMDMWFEFNLSELVGSKTTLNELVSKE